MKRILFSLVLIFSVVVWVALTSSLPNDARSFGFIVFMGFEYLAWEATAKPRTATMNVMKVIYGDFITWSLKTVYSGQYKVVPVAYQQPKQTAPVQNNKPAKQPQLQFGTRSTDLLKLLVECVGDGVSISKSGQTDGLSLIAEGVALGRIYLKNNNMVCEIVDLHDTQPREVSFGDLISHMKKASKIVKRITSAGNP